MLLLNPIVRKTSEKRSRWWTRLAGFGLWSVLQPICMSLNIRSIKEEHDDVYTAPFLVALWHNRTMVPGYAWSLAQKPLKMSVLTSASKDGALVEAVCRHFGLGAVRGSSGRRGLWPTWNDAKDPGGGRLLLFYSGWSARPYLRSAPRYCQTGLPVRAAHRSRMYRI